MDYKEANANIYQDRIVCGECGFMIAKVLEEKDENERGGSISVLCRRRDEKGVPCNTLNEINL